MRIPGQVCAYLDPIVGSAHAYLTKCQRPESTEREHMSGQEGRAPQAHLDLVDTRLRYDAYQIHTIRPHSPQSGQQQHSAVVLSDLACSPQPPKRCRWVGLQV